MGGKRAEQYTDGWKGGMMKEKYVFGKHSNGKNRFCRVKMARRGGILLPDLSGFL